MNNCECLFKQECIREDRKLCKPPPQLSEECISLFTDTVMDLMRKAITGIWQEKDPDEWRWHK